MSGTFDFAAVAVAVRKFRYHPMHMTYAGRHVLGNHDPDDVGCRSYWASYEKQHDILDSRHFGGTELSRENDVWDNRRKRKVEP